MRRFRPIICSLILSMLPLAAFCGPRSAGCVFGFDKASICWQQDLNNPRYFWEIGLDIHYAQNVFFNTGIPGFGANFSYNVVFASKDYASGRLNWYGGPGFCAGYMHDYKKPSGIMAGLAGNFGFEYSFYDSPVTLSLSVTPTLAGHLRFGDKGPVFTTWEYGFWFALSPKVGIRYRF